MSNWNCVLNSTLLMFLCVSGHIIGWWDTCRQKNPGIARENRSLRQEPSWNRFQWRLLQNVAYHMSKLLCFSASTFQCVNEMLWTGHDDDGLAKIEMVWPSQHRHVMLMVLSRVICVFSCYVLCSPRCSWFRLTVIAFSKSHVCLAVVPCGRRSW